MCFISSNYYLLRETGGEASEVSMLHLLTTPKYVHVILRGVATKYALEYAYMYL